VVLKRQQQRMGNYSTTRICAKINPGQKDTRVIQQIVKPPALIMLMALMVAMPAAPELGPLLL
jgi:hypothetical protein